MGIWMIGKNLMKTYLKKKDFYSHWKLKDITYTDYAHEKKSLSKFRKKNWAEYYQSNPLLLAYAFENNRNICQEK